MKKGFIISTILLVLILLAGNCTAWNTKRDSINTEETIATVKAAQETQMPKETFTTKTVRTVQKVFTRKEEILTDSQGLCYCPEKDEGEIISRDRLEVYAGKLKTKNVIIPNTFQGKKVVRIAEDGFTDCNKLEGVIIGKNIRSIGAFGFARCKKLSKIEFKGNKVTSIGSGAFGGCSSLKSLKLPQSVRFISESTFAGSGLVNFRVPNKVENLYENTFNECKALENIFFGKKLISIHSGCFEKCIGLRKVILPKTLVTLEAKAFTKCSNLQKVIFKGAVYNMSEDAFLDTPFEEKYRNKGDYYIVGGIILETYKKVTGDLCITNKTKINGKRIKGIGGSAYSKCKKIGKVVIKNIRGIGGKAFCDIKADSIRLQNVDEIDVWTFEDIKTSQIWMDSVKEVDQCFDRSEVSELYADNIGLWNHPNIPDGIEIFVLKNVKEGIGIGFSGKSKLKEVVLTGNIEQIEYYDFEKCTSLETITLESAQNIEWHWMTKYDWSENSTNTWFTDCKKLKKVHIRIPSIEETVKGIFPEWVTLHVPAEQVEEYQKYVTCNVVAW